MKKKTAGCLYIAFSQGTLVEVNLLILLLIVSPIVLSLDPLPKKLNYGALRSPLQLLKPGRSIALQVPIDLLRGCAGR